MTTIDTMEKIETVVEEWQKGNIDSEEAFAAIQVIVAKFEER